MTDQVNEAVAWIVDDGDAKMVTTSKRQADLWSGLSNYTVTPLYAHPARGVVDEDAALDAFDAACNRHSLANGTNPKVTWVGYTREDRLRVMRAALQAALPAVPSVPEGRYRLAISKGEVQALIDYHDWCQSEADSMGVETTGDVQRIAELKAMLAATPAHDQPEGSDND